MTACVTQTKRKSCWFMTIKINSMKHVRVCTDSGPAFLIRICKTLYLFAVCCQFKTMTTMMILAMLSQSTMTSPPPPSAAATRTKTTAIMRTTTPDYRCTINNGIVADETSCKSYLICLQGRVRPMECSRDLLFSRNLLTCDFPNNVDCDKRPIHVAGSLCYSAVIKVTLKIRNIVREPKFEAKVTITAPRQPLRYFLLIAAGLDPRFRYETQNFEGYGDFLSAINGLSNDVSQALAVWQPFDRNGKLIADNLDDYIPESNDIITFVYMDALG